MKRVNSPFPNTKESTQQRPSKKVFNVFNKLQLQNTFSNVVKLFYVKHLLLILILYWRHYHKSVMKNKDGRTNMYAFSYYCNKISDNKQIKKGGL